MQRNEWQTCYVVSHACGMHTYVRHTHPCTHTYGGAIIKASPSLCTCGECSLRRFYSDSPHYTWLDVSFPHAHVPTTQKGKPHMYECIFVRALIFSVDWLFQFIRKWCDAIKVIYKWQNLWFIQWFKMINWTRCAYNEQITTLRAKLQFADWNHHVW